jgi:hypothetical protein
MLHLKLMMVTLGNFGRYRAKDFTFPSFKLPANFVVDSKE